jgi:hypothetical protein
MRTGDLHSMRWGGADKQQTGESAKRRRGRPADERDPIRPQAAPFEVDVTVVSEHARDE